jgi:chromosome segregation protein
MPSTDWQRPWQLRDRLAAHESVVTRDGLWLGTNWLRVIREADSESGVLARRQELARVVEELALIEEQLATNNQILEEGRESLRALELQREDAQRPCHN